MGTSNAWRGPVASCRAGPPHTAARTAESRYLANGGDRLHAHQERPVHSAATSQFMPLPTPAGDAVSWVFPPLFSCPNPLNKARRRFSVFLASRLSASHLVPLGYVTRPQSLYTYLSLYTARPQRVEATPSLRIAVISTPPPRLHIATYLRCHREACGVYPPRSPVSASLAVSGLAILHRAPAYQKTRPDSLRHRVSDTAHIWMLRQNSAERSLFPVPRFPFPNQAPASLPSAGPFISRLLPVAVSPCPRP
ncbi:hypothetical protein BT67DRAFT_127158 [Trichocladium antarcticum]|uniref:Uncharacterized protein n=1 Tax=Trichocladium antarcticum TaxID=1450529 RepID=A0AAN6URZ1_9PEZI|nr:hypothetical protein BT67DRAFT_127158 [Trichocladium antarcticum]